MSRSFRVIESENIRQEPETVITAVNSNGFKTRTAKEKVTGKINKQYSRIDCNLFFR